MQKAEFKVVMIGAEHVGKTSLANRLQFNYFCDDYQPTVGAGFIVHRTTYEGREVELQIWDTAGMEKYKSLGAIYYRDSNAAIIVYDQTSPSSADALEMWLENFRNAVRTPAYIAIAANKDDLTDKCVSREKIENWAKENGFDFFITSAKSGTGVEEMFTTATTALMKSTQTTEIKRAPPILRKTKKEQPKGGCCSK